MVVWAILETEIDVRFIPNRPSLVLATIWWKEMWTFYRIWLPFFVILRENFLQIRANCTWKKWFSVFKKEAQHGSNFPFLVRSGCHSLPFPLFFFLFLDCLFLNSKLDIKGKKGLADDTLYTLFLVSNLKIFLEDRSGFFPFAVQGRSISMVNSNAKGRGMNRRLNFGTSLIINSS